MVSKATTDNGDLLVATGVPRPAWEIIDLDDEPVWREVAHHAGSAEAHDRASDVADWVEGFDRVTVSGPSLAALLRTLAESATSAGADTLVGAIRDEVESLLHVTCEDVDSATALEEASSDVQDAAALGPALAGLLTATLAARDDDSDGASAEGSGTSSIRRDLIVALNESIWSGDLLIVFDGTALAGSAGDEAHPEGYEREAFEAAPFMFDLARLGDDGVSDDE